jgi:hypothetical protein
MKGGFEELNAKLEAATVGLTGVTRKRVFGRNTFFVDGKLFALVWREGRIGLKFPDGATHAELAAIAGSTPWVAWGRPMAGWLLVPLAMHRDADALAAWVGRACEGVRAAAPAPLNETVAARVEPLPSPPRISVRVSPPPVSAPPAFAPPPPPPPAPGASAGGEGATGYAAAEFSFDDAAAGESAALRAASDRPPVPPSAAPAAEASSEASAGSPEAADEDGFSFDAPEPPPAATESQEFDFGGGEPEPPPAAAAEAAAHDAPATKKKKGGKGKKRTG